MLSVVANSIFQCGVGDNLCWYNEVSRHLPVSPVCLLDAVTASPRAEVGRDGVAGSEEPDEAGPHRPPVRLHGVSEGRSVSGTL